MANELNDQFVKKAVEVIHNNMQNLDFDKESFAMEMHVSGSLLYKKIKDYLSTEDSLLSVYHFPMRIGDVGLVIFGIFAGIFVGCLSMALAEAVKVFPVLCQRINLSYGIYLLIFMMAAGKFLGTLYQMYFERK